MAARRVRAWVLIPSVLGLLLALLPPAISAADGAIDELARPISDVALVSRAPGLPPDLLTLDTTNELPGEARLALLRRGSAGWSVVLDSPRLLTGVSDEISPPWLVDLGGGRYAVMAGSQNQPASFVQPVRLDTSTDPPRIFTGDTVVVEGWASHSGAADVDGDGENELVVASSSEGDENGRCADATVHIIRGSLLDKVDPAWSIRLKDVKALRLSTLAAGEFDGRPGTDLVAHVYDTCAPSNDGTEPHHLVAIRLADRSVIVDLPSPVEDLPNIAPTIPLVLDVDGDGRDEVVLSGPSGYGVYDPTDDWKRLAVGDDESPPLAVADGSTGTRAGTVTWVAPLTGSAASLRTARIERARGSLVIAGTQVLPLPDLEPDARDRALARMRIMAMNQLPSAGWTGDLDGDGCPELVLPLVIADCTTARPAVPGPSWLNSRPLADVGTPSAPRLLVAEGLEWYPYQESPLPPSPLAASPGWWRAGWFQPFYLAEVSLPLDGAVPPVAAPVIDNLTDRGGSVHIKGPAGTRLMWRVTSLPTGVATRDSATTMDWFLQVEPIEGEYVRIMPMLTPDSPGSATSTLPFAIAQEVPLSGFGEGSMAEHWAVSAVALDARGEPSSVSSAIVVYDQTAPAITLDTPMVSPPWPFEAMITGKSEPGVTVRSGDGPAVTVGPSGAFEIPTNLAPWPQSIHVVATDASGNATPADVSIMGGVDLRPLPWPAIAAVAIIIAVFLSSLRGVRRVRDIAPVAMSADEGGDLVIEELDPGSTYRRD